MKHSQRFLQKSGLFSDIKDMFEQIGIPCIPSEWCLFIDSSIKILEVFLIHNENKFSFNFKMVGFYWEYRADIQCIRVFCAYGIAERSPSTIFSGHRLEEQNFLL